MMGRLVASVRAHAIAYVALCCSLLSLAGASYAALSIPANSVGGRQLKNGSIDPVKMDPRKIGGTILHWAKIGAQGQVLASSSPARARHSASGLVAVDWGDKFPEARCIALATIRGLLDASAAPLEASFGPHQESPTTVSVNTINVDNPQQAGPTPSVFIAVIC